jgi:hypothetical protein
MFNINSNNEQASTTRRVWTGVASSTLLLGALTLFPEPGLTQETAQHIVAQNNALRARSAQEETLYLNNDRVYEYNLIAARSGTIDGVRIPAGATIVGRYEPAKGGLRYVARAVVFGDRSYRISAVSPVLEDVKDPRDTSVGAIAEDAGIGAAAGTILGEVFGDADVEEIVGGAVAGGVVGNVTADRVVVVEPDRPIPLYSN